MRRAFTLIELLVVIAIIAIMAAFLFPVFAQTREAARASACKSNLRQMGTAVGMYQQDNDGKYPLIDGNNNNAGSFLVEPPGSRNPNPITLNWQSSCWANSLQPYIKNWGIYKCPSGVISSHPTYGAALAAGQPEALISYTYNGLLANTNDAAIAFPADCITFWEGYGNVMLRNYAVSTPVMNRPPNGSPYPVFPNTSGCQFVLPDFNGSFYVHGRGSHYLYADGHVKWRPLTTDRDVTPWTKFDPNTGKLVSNQAWPGPPGVPPNCPYLFRPDGP